MSKDHPTPRADALRAQREERYGHLQATTDKPKLIAYAGKDRTIAGSRGGIPYSVNPKPDDGSKPARKRVKYERKIT
jgi:hypothetical protein